MNESQKPTNPEILSTSDPQRNQATLAFRNWWRNGAACAIAVGFTVLILLNLLQPWEVDVRGADYTTSVIERGTKTISWHHGVDAKGKANAFSRGNGWTTLVLMLGTLWLCSTPRPNWGPFRWLPMLAGMIGAWLAFQNLATLQREWDAFNATLSTKAIITYPPAMQWTLILSVLLAVCGAFLARVPKSTRQNPDHASTLQ